MWGNSVGEARRRVRSFSGRGLDESVGSLSGRDKEEKRVWGHSVRERSRSFVT